MDGPHVGRRHGAIRGCVKSEYGAFKLNNPPTSFGGFMRCQVTPGRLNIPPTDEAVSETESLTQQKL